jgi:hypothetical protein
MAWSDGRNRREDRIELLNGRWHMLRQSPRFGRCAACGRHVAEGARTVYRDGEVLHPHCAYHVRELT